MLKSALFILALVALSSSSSVVAQSDSDYDLALPTHNGKLHWSASGFKIIESSVKPDGNEIGIRAKSGTRPLTFLSFLFLFPEQAPLTSAKCRDEVLGPAMKEDSTLKVVSESEIERKAEIPVALATYSHRSDEGKYSVRGFVATADICGDLEVYSEQPISADDPDLRHLFDSLRLDPDYKPQFKDVFLYAQLLYKTNRYQAAAPIFELALKQAPDEQTRRVTTDQAGMAYGMSGNLHEARAIFENAIAQDPAYPLYYYNLACADAEEKNLAATRAHLEQAFERKANVLPGESMPDPAKDDSFLPYRAEKTFWSFIESLR